MDLVNALWITLIGMGLVFLAILALWGLMALLVRLTPEAAVDESEAEPEGSTAAELGSNAIPEEGLNLERKRRAAALAVAVALAQASSKPARPARETQPAGTVTAWQAVHRASQMSQRDHAMKKKVVR